MGRKERIEVDTKERKCRRLIKFLDRTFNFKDFINRQRFLKLTTMFMFLLVFVFTTIIITIFVKTGSEPSTIVSGFFDFVKWEFAGLSLIKVSENVGKSTNDKIKDVVEDTVEILDSTSDLLEDISDIGSANEYEE